MIDKWNDYANSNSIELLIKALIANDPRTKDLVPEIPVVKSEEKGEDGF